MVLSSIRSIGPPEVLVTAMRTSTLTRRGSQSMWRLAS